MTDHNKLIKRYEQALAREQTLRKAAEARFKELERERDEALKALEPFATTPYATIQGDAAMGLCTGITLGDLRRARDLREKINQSAPVDSGGNT